MGNIKTRYQSMILIVLGLIVLFGVRLMVVVLLPALLVLLALLEMEAVGSLRAALLRTAQWKW